MRISSRPFIHPGDRYGIPMKEGYHGVHAFRVHQRRCDIPLSLPPALFSFMLKVEDMLQRHVADADRYAHGTAYMAVHRLDRDFDGGVMHHDSGVTEPVRPATPTLRFVSAVSTDREHNPQNVFTDRTDLVGQPAGEVWNTHRAWFQLPPAGHVVMFEADNGLHGVRPAKARPDVWVSFYSAALYPADRNADLSCSALASLRHQP